MTDEEKIISVINIARRVTTTVKLMPFVYAFCIFIGIATYPYTSEDAQFFVDSICYISPIVVVYSLILSKQLKLCKWHKLQCILPLTQLVVTSLDIFEPLPETAARINEFAYCFIILLSFINAYFMFWRNTPTPPRV